MTNTSRFAAALFAAVLVNVVGSTLSHAGHFALVFQRQLPAWENSAGTGCIGGHVCRVWVWDENGKAVPSIQLKTTWNVLMGAADADGRAEIPLNQNDYDLKCVDARGSTSDATRLMTAQRPDCWGHYSFEVGFLYKTSVLNPGEFDLDLLGSWNERAPAPQDNDAPYTKSLAYNGADHTDYWSDQSYWGNWQNPPSYFGQTFVATGDRVVAARVQGTVGGNNLLDWKLQIVTFPKLTPVGPVTSVPFRWPFGWEAFWPVNANPVVPGQTYMLKAWRDGTGMNIYHVTKNVYPNGQYYEGARAFPQFDLNGHVVCMSMASPFTAEFVVLNKERVGRTVFAYECQVILKNTSSFAVRNVSLGMVKASANMVLIEPNVTFGSAEIGPGKSAKSLDTCTFTVDRAAAIDPAAIIWRATAELADTGEKMEHTLTSLLALDPPRSTAADFEGLAALADNWLWVGTPGGIEEDTVPDGTVNLADFARFADNWETNP